MKIWITEIGEPLPLEPNARLLRYGIMGPLLAKLGHEVTWWTSTFSHSNRKFVRQADCEETVDGVRLKVLHGPGYQKSISFKRLRHQAHFADRFSRLASQEPLPDLILTPIPTLEVAQAAVRFARRHHIPVLIDIRDEWPEEFVDLAPKMLRRLARVALHRQFSSMNYICRQATGIVGTGAKFLDYGLKYAGRIQHEMDAVLPFGYSILPPDPEKLQAARDGWEAAGVKKDKFNVCFFGTMGKFFDFTPVLQLARRWEASGKVNFILCGQGDQLADLRLASRDLASVFLPGWVDAPQISALMEISAVGLAPYRLGARMALPNKPIEYLSAGLPVVSSLTGELSRLLAENACGINYEPQSVDSLESALTLLMNDQAIYREMSESAKRVFANHFSALTVAKKMGEHFEIVRERSGLDRPISLV